MIRIFLALFFVVFPLIADEQDDFVPLYNNLHSYMAEKGFSQGAAAIARKGKLLSWEEWGGMSVHKVIPIASLSKVFTKWAIIDLILEGKLDWSTPASWFFHLENVQDERVLRISVVDLMDHRGGWKIERSADPLFNLHYYNTRWTPETFSTWYLSNFELSCEPGTEFKYCNAGYVILGRILEKVTQANYFDYIKRTIANPLRIRLEKARTPRHQKYYSLDLCRASFGLSSSAADLARGFSSFKGEWFQTGSISGLLTAVAYRHRSGITTVVLIPERNDCSWESDCADLKNLVLDSIEAMWSAKKS